MLGLGETEEELLQAMRDLRASSCDILTLGQYLQPTLKHLPVVEFVPPEKFAEYKVAARGDGFRPRRQRADGAQLVSRGRISAARAGLDSAYEIKFTPNIQPRFRVNCGPEHRHRAGQGGTSGANSSRPAPLQRRRSAWACPTCARGRWSRRWKAVSKSRSSPLPAVARSMAGRN